MTKRWTQRPEGSTWGDWGEDDQLGRLNLIDSKKVLQGIAEVKAGKTFCLSLPLDYPGGNIISPVRFPPKLKPVIRNNQRYYNYAWRDSDERLTDIASDDFVTLYTHYSTHWDSLAHRGSFFDINNDKNPKQVYYNGYLASKDVVVDNEENSVSAKSLGIENMALHGVQGRGVLVNLYKHFGEEPRKEVGYNDMLEILEKDNIVIEKGDILCLWTGLDNRIIKFKGKPSKTVKESCAVLNGFDKELLRWISDVGVAAIASDNIAIEATGKPLPENYIGSNLPLHEHCLFKLGVHIGELWYLAELASWLEDNNRSRFLLTAPPLRLTGAVGSPVTPIATV